MNKVTYLGAAMLILGAPYVSASIEHVMPRPKQVAVSSGPGFAIGRPVALSDPTASPELLRFMADAYLTPDAKATARITVKLGPIDSAYDYTLAGYPDEAYSISVSADEIAITAADTIGVTRAAQTLRIMALDCGAAIESAVITDWPAFKLRGFMHDVGRSFLPMSELKREIDLLSRFKVNTFHWHLTDNTGWRLQIAAYPQLTGSAAITRYPGMFYTRDDARELQDYAAERGMTIIPEIDMPGHSGPFERAMGHTMQTPEGKAELKTILAEVADIFDMAPYIHIGGDEKGFPDSYIIEMIDYVHSLGKKAVIWNRYNSPARPVDPAVIPCDLTTNWATSGTLSKGVPNIDMRYNYTNHFDLFADVVGIFKSSIFGVERGNPDVAGTISAAWNDTKTPGHDDIVRQNNIYANILASAERAWTGGGQQYIEQGGTTLPSSGSEYDEFADWERRFLYHKATTMAEAAALIPYVRQSDVRWRITDQMPNGGNAAAVLPPEDYIGAESVPSSFVIGNTSYGSSPATGAGIYLRHIWHPTVKGFYQSPASGMTAYAWTYVYSPVEQDAGALIEFYTYSRSGNEKAPEAGQWDRRGSRIWLNGSEIEAPVWEQPGAAIYQDRDMTGLTNENVTARKPVSVHLRSGWNQVMMKLPHANNGGTGRDKWQFTFVLTDPTGLNALNDVVYSPNRILDSNAANILSAIDEIKAWIDANVSDTPGFYPCSVAAETVAAIDEISATLSQTVPADERLAQAKTLADLFAAMKAAATEAGISQPVDGGIYTLHTPLRLNRYPTGHGVGRSIIGETAPSEASQWKFSLRPDGAYDIINHSDDTFVSPSSPNNTALTTVSARPSEGWSVKAADEIGYVIVTSGTSQWNQTNNARQEFAIFNWGNGNNITDTGCKYRFTVVSTPPSSITNIAVDAPVMPAGIYDLTGRRFPSETSLSAGIYIINGRKKIIR